MDFLEHVYFPHQGLWNTTIAGLVIHEARQIPEPSQAFTFHRFRFQVLRKSGNRLTLLKITPVSKLKTARAAKPAKAAEGTGGQA